MSKAQPSSSNHDVDTTSQNDLLQSLLDRLDRQRSELDKVVHEAPNRASQILAAIRHTCAEIDQHVAAHHKEEL